VSVRVQRSISEVNAALTIGPAIFGAVGDDTRLEEDYR
jgi:hypothetical protein